MTRLNHHLYLFDMDGTLVDTAGDLAATVNALRAADGLEPLGFEAFREAAAVGTAALLEAGFGIAPGHLRYEGLKRAFLADYGKRCEGRAKLFDGIQELLWRIEAAGALWAIATNKPVTLARAIVEATPELASAACLTGSDGLTPLKPAPDLLLKAMAQLSAVPAETLYVGDSWRDIAAGAAAGCETAFAAWGSCEKSLPKGISPTFTAPVPDAVLAPGRQRLLQATT